MLLSEFQSDFEFNCSRQFVTLKAAKTGQTMNGRTCVCVRHFIDNHHSHTVGTRFLLAQAAYTIAHFLRAISCFFQNFNLTLGYKVVDNLLFLE